MSDPMTPPARDDDAFTRISETGLRDGLQVEKTILPVADKLRLIEALLDAGLTRIEVTGFVNPKVVPQFADAVELCAALPRRPGVAYAAFVPNLKGAERAVAAGLDEVKVGGAVSESFNRLNVRMSNAQLRDTIGDIASMLQGTGTRLVGVVATAFGCPYEGAVPLGRVVEEFDRLVGHGARLIYLADTTGVADPSLIRERVAALKDRATGVTLGLHLHDTRGLGLANALAGHAAGVRDFEGSIAGLGGCPFAPLAVGNVCTEDLVHMLHRMGVPTGLDLAALLRAARMAQGMLGRDLPGMVMKAGPADQRHDAETRAPLPAA